MARSDIRIHDVVYANVEQAALAAMLAQLGIRGKIRLPSLPKSCREALHDLKKAIAAAEEKAAELAANRTATPNLQERTAQLLLQWFLHGR